MDRMVIDPQPAWTLERSLFGRPEGVTISRCGRLLAVADADGNRVVVCSSPGELSDGGVQLTCALEGSQDGIDYPHDVDFSPDGRLLAVANRHGASVAIFRRQPGRRGLYGPRPVRVLRGLRSRMRETDAAKFVPPHGTYLAAANLSQSAITFHRRGWLRRARFRKEPVFVLEGRASELGSPDGLAFSPDGRLLAVANHGAGTVTLYARGRRAPVYGPAPVAVLGGSPSRLRNPHSVAFSRDGTHLALSNAGGRAVLVHRCLPAAPGGRLPWSDAPVQSLEACDPATFEATNRAAAQEGGPKGIAFGPGCFAVCTAAFGVRLHRATR